MTLVKMPAAEGGEWWIVMHPLAVREHRLRFVRPIHVFTLLAQHLAPKNPGVVFGDCLALENKLFGVRFFIEQLRGVVSQVGDPIYPGAHMRDYHDHQRFLCVIDAYLGSLYASLELAARINWRLKPQERGLKASFREQAEVFPSFAFESRDWLKQVFDLRSELQHYGSAIPQVSAEPAILVKFSEQTRLEYFERETYQIPLRVLLEYGPLTYQLLDDWALDELKAVPDELEVDVVVETGPKSVPKREKLRAGELIQLARQYGQGG